MSTTTFDQIIASPRPAARTAASVRLTRRGRIVVFVLGLLALLALGLAISNGAGASSHAGTPEPTHAVVVAPGDTLWQIASDAAHGGDVRTMIRHIEDLNGLSGATLAAGQSIRVPD